MASAARDTLTDRPLLRRTVRPIAAFVGVVTVGVAGFVALADVGVVEAAFWLVDLTSIELHFQRHDGPERLTKAFALLVRTGMVFAGLWFGETVLSAAFGGQIREELRRVQTDRAIDDLDGHAIVCGYGMFGRTVASNLRADGVEAVVVERDAAEADRARREDFLVVEGDARQEETLRRAGADRAGLLVAAVDDSNVNVQIALVASEMVPDLRSVVRVGDEAYETLARRAGADVVVIPEVVTGEHLRELL